MYIFVSRSVLLRMKNVSDKTCTENQTINFMFSNLIFFENGASYEIMWKNIVEPERVQIDTDAHFTLGTQGYKRTLRICNTDFPLQQWLYESAPVLRFT